MCVSFGSNYSCHVSATELDKFVCTKRPVAQVLPYTAVKTCSVPSTGSLMNSQQLFGYATSPEKSETNTTELDGR